MARLSSSATSLMDCRLRCASSSLRSSSRILSCSLRCSSACIFSSFFWLRRSSRSRCFCSRLRSFSSRLRSRSCSSSSLCFLRRRAGHGGSVRAAGPGPAIAALGSLALCPQTSQPRPRAPGARGAQGEASPMFPGRAWLNSTPAQTPEQTRRTRGKRSFHQMQLLLQGPQQTNQDGPQRHREEALHHGHHTGTAGALDRPGSHCTRDPCPGLSHPEPPAPELEGSRNAPGGRKVLEAPSYWKPPREHTAWPFMGTCRKGICSVTQSQSGLLWGGRRPSAQGPHSTHPGESP